MSLLLGAGARSWRLLLVTGLVATATTAFAPVLPAAATNEGYSCAECAYVNGHENYVRNNEAINYTRTGVGDYVWRHNGNGTYTKVLEDWTTGYLTIACGSEVYGHGEVLEASGEHAHLAGRQDNFQYCG
ncbi:MAG: hypothetical protein ACLPUT_02975 [Solirubrobacteraceae bacterium]